MEEIALTIGRHDIVSPITGEQVTESFFGHVVEDPLNIASHMKTVGEKLSTVPLGETLVVYVTGLSSLFQAVFAVWLDRNCNDTTMSLDMHPGKLVFAHYDRDVDTYCFIDALSGETIEVSELAS
jgi:hypothetical protein